jgi:hypothetical protein
LQCETIKKGSKFIVGYIPYIDNISNERNVNHLITKCGLITSKANDSITVYSFQFQCSFWNEAKNPINKCHRNGCSAHILGKGINCIHTCVPFTVGGIPAQMHRRHIWYQVYMGDIWFRRWTIILHFTLWS